jgi:carbonic anhydrase
LSDTLLRRTLRHQHSFFEEQANLPGRLLKEGQAPTTLFIGCSDPRLTPERLFGAMPGEMMMLRNIGNLVPPYYQTEIGISSALEYAVLHVKVAHLVVCGHTDCGAVIGLDSRLDLAGQPGLSRWLEIARPAQREVEFQMRGLTGTERHEAIVECNVVHQLHNLCTYPFIRQALEANLLEMHGWVYYLERREIRYHESTSDAFLPL